ncbi:hypothetical protein [Vibrio sp. HN007]|uniref:hypothetical protein n=1 Tax=Vibrio iocasae TaxID=3098914 RepID=UPI0035D4FD6F
MPTNKLAIVIHAEEEFDWKNGFYRANTKVSHDRELIQIMDTLIDTGAKVTIAMDYPFIKSVSGEKVVDTYKKQDELVEFASHLHPWVTPPYADENEESTEYDSYPCNLPYELEQAKLKTLTETIGSVSGLLPSSYLAGRYGIGTNTNGILKELGYKVDLSISAYSDLTNQSGPDFSMYSNARFMRNGITHLPRTSSIISKISILQSYLNKNPELFSLIQKKVFGRLILKILRVKQYYLSPEGFTLEQMKKVTLSQIDINQHEFVMSFHSPSLIIGSTPYVSNVEEYNEFCHVAVEYVRWFTNDLGGEVVLAKDFANE